MLYLFGSLWAVDEFVFVVRDFVAIIILPPMYLFMISRIRGIPSMLDEHVEDVDVIRKPISTIFPNRWITLSGLIITLYFVIDHVWQIVSGSTELSFAIGRLINMLGIFLAAEIIIEVLWCFKILVKDASKLVLRPSGLFGGIEPISRFGLYGIVVWMVATHILIIPFYAEGIAIVDRLWYSMFYGLTVLIGLATFGAVCYGLHKAMVRTKLVLSKPMIQEINTRFLEFSSSVESASTEDMTRLQTLVDIHNTVAGAKEWPIGWTTIQQILITYLIPIALSIIGLSLTA